MFKRYSRSRYGRGRSFGRSRYGRSGRFGRRPFRSRFGRSSYGQRSYPRFGRRY